MQNRKMILVIRTIHGIITATFLSCIIYIYYSALTNQKNTLSYVAVGLIIFEGITVTLNKGNCPLGVIHKKYGDDKAFFELLLPKRAAKLAVPVLGLVAGIGMIILLV